MRKSARWPRLALSVSLVLLISLGVVGGLTAHAATPDTTAPTKPAGLTASAVGETSLTLAWQASTDNIGVKSYAIYCNNAYYSYSTTVQYKAAGLAPGTTYSFYIAAQDAAGNISGKSNVVTVQTLGSAVATPAPSRAPSASPVASPSPTPAATASAQPTAAPSTAPAPQGKVVAGYYASWASYAGYTPAKIPAANLTHLIYAFANIDLQNKIMLGDASADPTNFTALNALKKQYPALKTLISVGGWDWSGRFSTMASTAAGRQTFAASTAVFLKQYGFDGVDLDWEYPTGGGMAGNAASPNDTANFTELIKALRCALDTQGKADGRRYQLTIAGGADASYVSHVQLAAIAPYLDFALDMTYDMHGSFDKYTDLNAPLYASTGQSPQQVWSVDQSVKAWTKGGFPKSKLIVGVPFYGEIYTGVTGGGTGLFKPYKNVEQISYDKVASGYVGKSGYKRTYASSGKTPYLFNGSTFISYEDATSITAKATYINAGGFAGAGVWELSLNTSGTLLGVLKTHLK